MPPVVSSISPEQGPVSGGTPVVITGTGLTGATTVRFGFASASFSVVSSTRINAVAPPGSSGSVPVWVTSPSGSSNVSVYFTYTASSAPVVTGLSPSGGSTSGGTVVTVTGSSFLGATQVRFGSVDAASFSVVSGSVITAVSPPGVAGSVPVRVTTPAGTSAAAPQSYFFYAPAPVLTALAPSTGGTAGGNSVVVTGSGLFPASEVRFGALSAGFSVVSDTELVAQAPPGSGQVQVTVTTPGGTSNPLAYAYVGAPTLSGLSPSSGPAAGITVVTLTGSGLAGTADVTADGVPVAFTVLSDTQVTAMIPAGPVGGVAIRVTTAGGTSGAVLFQRLAAPEI
ncbi:IPT/TIG domain-containing protein [Streptomyces broussonetiae]|uniref:IPT/TIG domain-containing protein n=1 Tax=Streptomyces broussonetiae TaxID=2686304 RepID=A0ABV5EDI4_9ACTN